MQFPTYAPAIAAIAVAASFLSGIVGISAGDEVDLDLASGTIRDVTTGKSFRAQPMPDFMRAIFDAGGLVEFAKRRLQSKT